MDKDDITARLFTSDEWVIGGDRELIREVIKDLIRKIDSLEIRMEKMPELPNQIQSDDQEFNGLMAEATKQYEVYIELNQLTSILNSGIPVENYQRDLSHPLSIQLKG